MHAADRLPLPIRGLLVAVLAVAAAMATPPAHAGEDTLVGGGDGTAVDGGDSSATAINTRDGTSLFRFAFDVRRVMQGAVDQQNLAYAYASCTECQTVAVSFQVVLTAGDLNEVEPENYAVAVNEECSSCDTLASAYQFVLGGEGPMRFTAEGNKRLAELRRRLLEARQADASIEELQAEFEAIADEIDHLLDNEVQVAGDESEQRDDADSEQPPADDGEDDGNTDETDDGGADDADSEDGGTGDGTDGGDAEDGGTGDGDTEPVEENPESDTVEPEATS